MTLTDSLILVGCLVLSASISVNAEVSVYEVEFSDFDEVIIEGAHELELSVGTPFDIRVQGASTRDVLVAQDGRALHLGIPKRSSQKNQHVKFRVSLPVLKKAVVASSGHLFLQSVNSTAPLTLTVKGSGAIYAKSLTVDELTAQIGGSGRIEVASAEVSTLANNIGGSGNTVFGDLTAGNVSVSIAGAGDLEILNPSQIIYSLTANLSGSGGIVAKTTHIDHLSTNLIGSGDIEVATAQTIRANIIGSGNVRYRGEASVSSSVLGSGQVERID